MSGTFPQTHVAAPEEAGQRLDAFLVAHLDGVSRSLIKRAIDAGHVTVDGERRKPSHRLEEGESVVVTQLEEPAPGPKPEAIALELLYEDDDLVAVNKPAGMVVHPAKGHWEGTLASALAHHFGDALSTTGGPTRPGIVHRLDRDTTGVIVVAKHDTAHERLAEQFQSRTVAKEYLAIVLGEPDRDADVIDEPIGPHPHVREKMAIRRDHPDAREAVTTFEVVERLRRCSLIRALPKTGRTHQIRVHLAHLGCPVLCDKQYGGRSRITASELAGGVVRPGRGTVAPAAGVARSAVADRAPDERRAAGVRGAVAGRHGRGAGCAANLTGVFCVRVRVMDIRRYQPGEEHELWLLFHNTIRNVNTRDYTEDQVRVWAPDEVDPEKWRRRIEGINPLVCVEGGVIVGYTDVQPSGLIDHFFVHHKWQRRGIGRRLMRAVHDEASALSLDQLHSHVSITARPFYEAHGFHVEKEQLVEDGA